MSSIEPYDALEVPDIMSFKAKKKELTTLIFEEPRNSYRGRYFENVLDVANYSYYTASDPLDACLILDIALDFKNIEWPSQKGDE